VAAEWDSIMHHMSRTRGEEQEEKTKKALEKKNSTTIMDFKRKVFLLYKWNILKEKRNELQEEFKEKYKGQKRAIVWHTLTAMFYIF